MPKFFTRSRSVLGRLWRFFSGREAENQTLLLERILSLLNQKLDALDQGLSNEQSLLNDKLGDLRMAVANQSTVLNDQLSREAFANQATVLNDQLSKLRQAIADQSNALNQQLSDVREAIENQSKITEDQAGRLYQDGDDVRQQLATLNVRLRDLQERLTHRAHSRSKSVAAAAAGGCGAATHELKEISFPPIKPRSAADLMRLIRDESFRALSDYFSSSRHGLVVLPEVQAFLFSLIRSLQPNCVVEIGQYHPALTTAMGEALGLNGRGVLHVLPGRDKGGPWLIEKHSHGSESVVRSYAVDALTFVDTMNKDKVAPELVVVNNADDFGISFVLERMSRLTDPAGLLLVRDPQRPDILEALKAFLSECPDWERNALLAPHSASEESARTAYLPPLMGTEYAFLFAPQQR
jgi:hypothetical protein